MMSDNLVNRANINRFDGYSSLYNTSRPIPPAIIPEIVIKYLGKTPEVVLDIGSGTGLSTLIWKDTASKIIGIEPNDDMRSEAGKNIKDSRIKFLKGVSNDTGLPSDYADVIAISQAFHWMDIDSTLAEAHRLLKDGGVFAVFDCDWPPAVDWQVEKAYKELRQKCDEICSKREKPAVQNDKSSYICRFNESGKFRFITEAVCHSVEECDARRVKGIALSQGGIQEAMKLTDNIETDVNAFCELVDTQCKGEFNIIFSYRLRIGIK